MTRKDFELIARTLRDARPPAEQVHMWRHIVLSFAARLKVTNERFDDARFIKACGV